MLEMRFHIMFIVGGRTECGGTKSLECEKMFATTSWAFCFCFWFCLLGLDGIRLGLGQCGLEGRQLLEGFFDAHTYGKL